MSVLTAEWPARARGRTVCGMSDEKNDKSSKEEQAKVSDEARADNEDTTSGGAPEEPDN